MGKSRKLPMRKRETEMQRYATFSRRRKGLFKKCAELAMLCDAQVALFMNWPDSSKLKIYGFGHPSVDAVLDSSLSNASIDGDDATRLLAISLSEETRFLEREVGEIMKVEVKLEKVTGGFSWDFGYFEKSKSSEELSRLVKVLENFMLEARNGLASSASGASSSSSSSTNENNGKSDDQFVYHLSDITLLSLRRARISPFNISPSSDMENKQTAPELFPNAHPLLESASYLDYGGKLYPQTAETHALMDVSNITPWIIPDSLSSSGCTSNLSASLDSDSKNKLAASEHATAPFYYYPGEDDAIDEISHGMEDDLGMKIDAKLGSNLLDLLMEHDNYVAVADLWNEDGILNPEPLAWCYCSVSEIRPCHCCQARESSVFPCIEA